MNHSTSALCLAAALCLLGSCAAEDPQAPRNTETFTQVASPLSFDYDASHFATPDNSRSLSRTNHMIDLKYILAAMDPQRALDISMFSEKSDPNALTADQLAQMKAKADEVTKDCKNNLEKLKALQNFVIKNTTYDNNGNGRNDPYGAFSGGVCVCQGYANILKVLLYTQGIPCIGINGNLFQGDVYLGAHAWDYVYADGKWYVNDPTNGGFFEMDKIDTYKHLQPLRTDIEVFEDDQFGYDFFQGHLNVSRVKSSGDILTVPFSTHKLRVSAFIPHQDLPKNVKQVYLGRNIVSLGDDQVVSLAERGTNVETVFVEDQNTKFAAKDGVVYTKNWMKKIESLVFIPAAMKSVKLQPIERLEKNIIARHNSIEQLVIVPGTKVMESYAVESCPNLKRVYLPNDCEMQKDALYRCAKDVQITRGDFTGIARVRR